MQTISTSNVVRAWKLSGGDFSSVRDFLLKSATPVVSMPYGKGSHHIWPATVVDLKDAYKQSLPVKPKQDMAALAAKGRAAYATKRAELANHVTGLEQTIARLERRVILLEAYLSGIARGNNGSAAHFQEARA